MINIVTMATLSRSLINKRWRKLLQGVQQMYLADSVFFTCPGSEMVAKLILDTYSSKKGLFRQH